MTFDGLWMSPELSPGVNLSDDLFPEFPTISFGPSSTPDSEQQPGSLLPYPEDFLAEHANEPFMPEALHDELQPPEMLRAEMGVVEAAETNRKRQRTVPVRAAALGQQPQPQPKPKSKKRATSGSLSLHEELELATKALAYLRECAIGNAYAQYISKPGIKCFIKHLPLLVAQDPSFAAAQNSQRHEWNNRLQDSQLAVEMLQRENTALQSNLDKREAEAKELQRENSQLLKDCQRLQHTNATLQSNLSVREAETKELQDQHQKKIVDQEKKCAMLTRSLEEAQQAIQKCQAELNEKIAELNAKTAELCETTKQLQQEQSRVPELAGTQPNMLPLQHMVAWQDAKLYAFTYVSKHTNFVFLPNVEEKNMSVEVVLDMLSEEDFCQVFLADDRDIRAKLRDVYCLAQITNDDKCATPPADVILSFWTILHTDKETAISMFRNTILNTLHPLTTQQTIDKLVAAVATI